MGGGGSNTIKQSPMQISLEKIENIQHSFKYILSVVNTFSKKRGENYFSSNKKMSMEFKCHQEEKSL